MRGRRPEADPRFTFHASRFTVLGSGPRTMQMVCGSFAAVEQSMSDRLLAHSIHDVSSAPFVEILQGGWAPL
jgi:hypothetical protein